MASAPGTAGRLVTVKRGPVTPTVLVGGVRTKGITINGAPIDVTTDDSAGWRALLDLPGQVDVSISVSGISVAGTGALRTEAIGTTDRVQPTEFQIPGAGIGGTFTGEFFLASFSQTGEYNGAATFEAEFQSAGPITYVAL
jgi:TP901-1 family phage major tail protein